MPSTATTRLELQKQTTGGNPDTWGEELNEALDVLDLAIAGAANITMAGAAVTLTDDNYEADQSRAFMLNLSGTSGNIVVPAREKAYAVYGGQSSQIYLTNGTSTMAVLPQSRQLLWTDGTNWRVISRTWGYYGNYTFTGTDRVATGFYNDTNFDDMRVDILGASHNSGTPSFEVAISADGSAYSAYDALGTATFAASATVYGRIEVMGKLGASGIITGGVADLSANLTTGAHAGESVIPWRSSAGIKTLKFQMGGSTFDAGSIDVWLK